MPRKLNRSVLEPSVKIPLKTLYEIRDNQYRSKHCDKDYYPHLVDELIWRKEEKRATMAEKQMAREMREYEQSKDKLKQKIKECRSWFFRIWPEQRADILREIKQELIGLGINVPKYRVLIDKEEFIV